MGKTEGGREEIEREEDDGEGRENNGRRGEERDIGEGSREKEDVEEQEMMAEKARKEGKEE